MKNKQGFTLVELLVVIAIIGILSTVAIVNLNSAREKARAASVTAALSQITSAAIICQDDGLNLQSTAGVPCNNTAPVAGVPVCAGSTALWPALPPGGVWTYSATCNSDFAAGTWDFAASGGGRTVTCSNGGCTST